MARRLTPQEIIERDKRVALRTSSAASKRRLIKLLRKANDRLANRFENVSTLRGAGTDTFSRTQSNVVMRQLREVMKELRVGMRNDIVTAGKETATAASRDSMRYLNAAEKKYRGIVAELPVKQAMIIDRVNAGIESSILHRIESDPKHPRRPGVLDRYDTNVIRTFEEELQLRLLARQPWSEVRSSITKASPFLKGKPAHWAERIVRTETMYAHNRASFDTIRESNEQLGDMLKILSATFDDRTGADSLAVHGQIRRPSEPFESWYGFYMHPPNRPNDREVVVPHRMSWPLPPELEPVSDAEVLERWTLEKRKGAPPDRPELSTVDRGMIGKVEPPPIQKPPED